MQGDKCCDTLWEHWEHLEKCTWKPPRPQVTEQTQGDGENEPFQQQSWVWGWALHIQVEILLRTGVVLPSGKHSNVKPLQLPEHKPWSPISAFLPHYTSFIQHSLQELDSLSIWSTFTITESKHSPKWLNEEHKLQNFLPGEFSSCCSKHFCASISLEQSQSHANSRKHHMDPVDWNWSLMTTFHL